MLSYVSGFQSSLSSIFLMFWVHPIGFRQLDDPAPGEL